MQRVLDYLAAWVPAGWGNRNQVEVPTPAVAHPHQNTQTANLRGNAIVTAKKILKICKGRQFRRNLKNTYKCELTDCVIDMREWLDPLTSDDPEAVGCLIDLEPLRRQLAQYPVLNTHLSGKSKKRFSPLRYTFVKRRRESSIFSSGMSTCYNTTTSMMSALSLLTLQYVARCGLLPPNQRQRQHR
jgi:hypothetical protein